MTRFPSGTSAVGSLNPEEVDMLRDAFIYMDRDNDGHVKKEELLEMVRRCVGDERYGPLEAYLIPLFDVADKDKDNKLSLIEFLMSFADGPGVVPAEVINSCVSSIRVRLTNEEIATLQESFRRIDTKGDGYIDKEELAAALKENLKSKFPDLQDNNFKDIVAVIMASADADSDGRLCLSEFIRSFQEDQGVLPAAFVDVRTSPVVQQLTEAEIGVLKEAFAVLDKNKDGYVEFVDIYDALWESLSTSTQDGSQIRELCDLIMVTADRNKSALLTLADFVRSFVRNMGLVQIPVAAANVAKHAACERLQEMLINGELEALCVSNVDDSTNVDGCVDPNTLVHELGRLFRDAFPALDEETVASVMGAAAVASDTDGAKNISLEEFVRAFAEGPRIATPDASSPSPAASVTSAELEAVSEVLHGLGARADGEGCVPEAEVMDAMRAAFGADPKRAERVAHYVRDGILQHAADGAVRVGAARVDTPAGNPKQNTENTQAAEKVEKAEKAPTASGMGAALVPTIRLSDTQVNKRVCARRYLSSVYDTADSAIYDDELRREFAKYAAPNQTALDREEFKRAYLAMEHYGLIPTDSEVDRLFSKYSKGKEITYEQFCIIMLQRARM